MTSELLQTLETILLKSLQRGPEVAGSQTSTRGGGSGGKRNNLRKDASASGVVIDKGKLEGVVTWIQGDGSRLGGRGTLGGIGNGFGTSGGVASSCQNLSCSSTKGSLGS